MHGHLFALCFSFCYHQIKSAAPLVGGKSVGGGDGGGD